MTIWILVFSLLWPTLAVLAYRLGLADGLSAGRRGHLAGGKPQKEEDLLARIDAYGGRKERNGTADLA